PCPLLALSGHNARTAKCPLSGVERTFRGQHVLFVFDPKRTFGSKPSLGHAAKPGRSGAPEINRGAVDLASHQATIWDDHKTHCPKYFCNRLIESPPFLRRHPRT